MNDLFLQEDSVKVGAIYEIMSISARWQGIRFAGCTTSACYVLVLEGCEEYFTCLTSEGIFEFHITSFKMTNEKIKK